MSSKEEAFKAARRSRREMLSLVARVAWWQLGWLQRPDVVVVLRWIWVLSWV